MTWDRANRLIDWNQSSVPPIPDLPRFVHTYDGLGNRVRTQVITEGGAVIDYLLDVQPGLAVVLRQTTNSAIHGVSTDHYVHGVRGVHAVDDGSTWEWYMQDGLGSIRNDGLSYDPYGNPDSVVSGFAFTGQWRDSTGLQYHRARYYSPDFGTWMSLDPLETSNRYAYVSGDPINRVDPTGLFNWCTGEIEPGDTLWSMASLVSGYIHPSDFFTSMWPLNRNHPAFPVFPAGQAPQYAGMLLNPSWPPIQIRDDIRAYAEVQLGISCRPIPDVPCLPDTLREPIKDWPPIPPVGNPQTPRQRCEPLQNASSRFWEGDPYFGCCVDACRYYETYDIECVRECTGLNDPVNKCSPTGLIEFTRETYGLSYAGSVYAGLGGSGSVTILTDGTGRYVVFSGGELGIGLSSPGALFVVVWSEARLDEFAGITLNGSLGLFASGSTTISLDGLCNQTHSVQLGTGAGASVSVGGTNYFAEFDDITSVIEFLGLEGEAARTAIDLLAPAR